MTDIIRTIHPNDEMWIAGPDWYFTVGEDALKAIQRALSSSYMAQPRRILDLPCGHGRVARHLRHRFPEAELFFCDVDQTGLEFCAREFQGEAIASKPELTEVRLPHGIDLIWVGSLFTHVDRDRTERWLRYMCDHLGPQGVLVATFHGAYSIKNHERSPLIAQEQFDIILTQYQRTGYGYAAYPYAYYVDNYGISISKPAVIIEMASNIPGIRIIGYHERGWANNHDVLAVTKNDRLALS